MAGKQAQTKFGMTLIIFQVIFLILFGIFVEYDDSANAKFEGNSKDIGKGGADPSNNMVSSYYGMFQDVHVMIFIGFGFLMTFLRRYTFSSVGLNLLIAAFVIQWAMLFSGLLHLHHGKIQISITNMLTADFAAAAVLITFGALLGKTSPLQMIIISVIEIICFSINEHIGVKYLKAVDVGGSMFVHAFGAYYGLAICRVLWKKDIEESSKEGSEYHSDVFSMIGTVFLWMFWPSFNSALAPGDDQHRAVINTYLSLAACCVVAFAVSVLVSKEGKFDMVHIQNSTLAGGVAVGTSADMMIHPWGAILIGSLAGALSVVGYRYLSPLMASKLKIHDTCGVNNLHGMPGVMAGVIGAIVAAAASTSQYGNSLYQIFPARAPGINSTELLEIQTQFSAVTSGDSRSAGTQAAYQLLALLVTMVIAIVTGLLTGLLLRLKIWDEPEGNELFDDGTWWETPDNFSDEYREVPNGGSKGITLLEDVTFIERKDESEMA